MPSPEPLLFVCEALAYLCRAAETKELGTPPVPPSGQWVIDAARSVRDVPLVHAVLVEPAEDDAENIHDYLGNAEGPSIDTVIG